VGKSSFNLSTLGGLGAIVLWSTTFAFARSLSEQVGPLTAGAAAYLVGGCFCVARIAVAGPTLGQLRQLSWRYLLVCGGLFVFYPVAIYLAVGLAKNRQQLLEIALVNYLWPALTVLFSLPLLRNKANLWFAPGTILALSGVLLVMTQDNQISWEAFEHNWGQNPAAYSLVLAGAIALGLYSNFLRRWSEPGRRGAVEWFIPVAVLVLLGLRTLTVEPTNWSRRTVGEAVGLAAATALSYALWEGAMRKGNLLLVAACSYFTPLLSTLVSCFYLRISPSPKLWIGCGLLVTGSIITWRSVRNEHPGL